MDPQHLLPFNQKPREKNIMFKELYSNRFDVQKLMSLLGSKYNIFHNFDHISNAYMQMEPEKHAILIEN